MTEKHAEDLALEFLSALRPLSLSLRARRTLSEGKVGILRHLAAHGPAMVSELAAAIHVSAQGASLGVRDLETVGCVERRSDETDRRRVWIAITDSGREALATESSASANLLRTAVAHTLDDEERATLAAAIPVLAKLGASILDE
ncbi:MarR family winged helix-turn-helix transcriptional regulator [Gulosibacter molinativorax]|uniref:MarR family winged helix-turn-helix transcriptional regulator n=1 Tax=Gulosibacter molinativorax TaxID=256821 RepID=UPI0004185BB9|nr:MarR family transcriptional regulator [Gulosibacter molinativorax]QUY61237.1 MarR family transcriptional regulator [Gulosibacter molinativorax]